MKRSLATMFVLAAIWAGGRSIAAHHSFAAEYDRDKPITLKGSVTKIEWMNPHVYFYIDVADPSGATANWAIEGGATGQMRNIGLPPSALKPGDRVTVTAHPLRDGVDRRVLVQRLLLIERPGRFEVEDDLLDGSREGVGRLVLVVEVDDEAVVAADVHAGV